VPKTSAVDLASVPKLPADTLRLLWVNDFYDRPLEAVVERSGERLLLLLHGDGPPDVDAPIRWLLFRLTPEQWVEEDRWHALFEEHVGHHWCFHHDDVPDGGGPKDPDRFYVPYRERTPLDLTGTTPIGWVDELPPR